LRNDAYPKEVFLGVSYYHVAKYSKEKTLGEQKMANDLIFTINYNPGGKHYQRMMNSRDFFEVRLDAKVVGRIKESKNFLVPNGVHTVQCIYHTTELNDSFETVNVKRELGVFQFETMNESKYFTVNYYSKSKVEFWEDDVPMNQEMAANYAKACYIATCVYGSYDCPQVWTLRRYRDTVLERSWFGKKFIGIYYAISPTLVKWFGDTKWFKWIFKRCLDKKVARLQQKGIKDSPYDDMNI